MWLLLFFFSRSPVSHNHCPLMRKTTVSDTGLVDTTFPPEWSAETKSEIGGRVLERGWSRCVQVHSRVALRYTGKQTGTPRPDATHWPPAADQSVSQGSQARENGVQKHNGTLIRTTQPSLHWPFGFTENLRPGSSIWSRFTHRISRRRQTITLPPWSDVILIRYHFASQRLVTSCYASLTKHFPTFALRCFQRYCYCYVELTVCVTSR